MPCILVIDAGTTSFKAAIFNESLRLQRLASREFRVLRPTTDRAELDPQVYWSSCVNTIREALRNSSLDVRQIAAIAVTSHTDTLFALDANGQPVANAILWSDPRAQPQAERIQNQIGVQQLYRVTGQTGASSVHFAARLAWFYENQDGLAKRVKHFFQTQDYLIFCLSGEAALDHSIACCSLLAHLERPEYWPAMLTIVGGEMEKLSRIVQPGQAVGHLKPEVAKVLGLPSGIPVIPAAMDAAAANVAIRSVAPECVTDITGAALVIGVTCDAPTFDPHMRVPCFAHALPGKYLLLPWCETAGMALRWYRDNFFTPATAGEKSSASSLYDQITAEAAEAPPGSDGVVLLPHFAGSGSPDFNPAAKACIFGLTLGHQRKHISRAFLGVDRISAKAESRHVDRDGGEAGQYHVRGRRESLAFMVSNQGGCHGVAGERVPLFGSHGHGRGHAGCNGPRLALSGGSLPRVWSRNDISTASLGAHGLPRRLSTIHLAQQPFAVQTGFRPER